MKLFIVGQYKEGIKNVVWSFQGAFTSRKRAEKACIKDSFFVAPAKLNEELPVESIEWEGLYYPSIQGSRS